MATLTAQPDFVNLATGPNVYTLTDIGTAERYVLKVEIDGVIKATVKQTPNEASVAHFDIQEILRSSLSEISVETLSKATGVAGAAIRYRVQFGVEDSGAFISSGFSSFKVALNGYKAFNELQWTSANDYLADTELVACLGGGNIREVSQTNFLTESTVDTLLPTDWYTLSLFNFHREPLTANINATPWAVGIILYEGNVVLDEYYYTLKEPLIGPRTDCTDALLPLLSKDQVVHIGVGPENLRQITPGLDVDNATRIEVNVFSYDSCKTPLIPDCDDQDDIKEYAGPLWATKEFKIENPCTKFEPIQLSFMNKFGVPDYYTFIRRNDRTDNINRNNYLADPGTWNSATYTIADTDRGYAVANTGITSEVEVSTDWLDDDTSKWLRELFLSPAIKAYYEGQWQSVIGVTTTYEEKTEARNNRLYRHNIRVRLSNNIRVQK